MLDKCAGVILAGGLGTRMLNQDKGLIKLKERALIEYQIEMLKDQVDYLVISANRNLDEYRAYGLPVITDLPEYLNMGPLGGIYSVCSQLPNYIARVQIVPCDSPFLPGDLVQKLGAPIDQGAADITMAVSESGEHPIVMQFKLPLLAKLKEQLDDGINLRLRSFIRDHRYQTVQFDEQCFINFNDPETLAYWNNTEIPLKAKKMRDYDEALTELLAQSAAIATPEQQSLNDAAGRILAKDLIVQYDSPMFDNSAMDGYAVNDITAASWELVGQVAAGDDAGAITLQPGQAVRIFTGAGVPNNTDAVVIQENTTVTDKTLFATQAVKAGANIRRQGEELTKGQTLVTKQTLLSPAVVGLIASQGISTVSCFKPLTVTLFSTGDELTAPGQALQANRIYDANRPMLATLLKQHAYLNVIDGGMLPDNFEAIKDKMQSAAASSDIILSSGGASVGDKDYVKEVLTAIGHLEHWKLAIKPGKPFAWGHIDACKVFLLPGNPVSSFVTFLIMALPAIKQLSGHTDKNSRPVVWQAQADFTIDSTQNRREFLRGTIDSNASGLWAKRLSGQGSHMLSGCAFADILIEVPADTPVKRGQWLNIYPL